VPEMAVKRLESLRKLIPGISRILVPSFLAAARRPRFHEVGIVRELSHRLEQAAAGSFGTTGRFVPYLSSEAVGLSSMRFPLAIILVTLASTAQAQSREQKPVDWRTFEIPDFGTRIQYPAGIFSPAGKPEKGVGQRFERADGRAILSIYSHPNEAGDNPATYLRHNLRVSRSALDYARITRSFFAISSERGGVILYSRCNFSGGARGAIHCFDLKYPQEEKRSWDAVVTRISLSLRPLES
jgi:hypothetical protein